MKSVCMHFNFYDLEKIRKNIDEDLKPFYSRKEKNCLFATSAKIYPYNNQIVSLRVIIAVFFKIPIYEVSTQSLDDYKESMKEADQPIKEEEDSDDGEEEQEKKNNDENNNDNDNDGSSPGKTKEESKEKEDENNKKTKKGDKEKENENQTKKD